MTAAEALAVRDREARVDQMLVDVEQAIRDDLETTAAADPGALDHVPEKATWRRLLVGVRTGLLTYEH